MFFKELYHYSKPGFGGILLFLFTYFLINYKWGVVAAPVFQFGMYSSKFHINDDREIYQLQVNGKPLDYSKLSFTDIDKIQFFLARYEKQTVVNESVFKTIQKYPVFSHVMNWNEFSNHLSDHAFSIWYKALLEKILNTKIYSLTASKQQLVWVEKNLQPSASPIKLNFVVLK